AVERALRQTGHGGDGGGVDDRGVGRAAQVRQGGPGDAHHADHVDVVDPVPLLVRVVLDRAGRADAGVVDQDVYTAEGLGRGGHGGAHRAVVRDVGDEAQLGIRSRGRVEVEHGDGR